MAKTPEEIEALKKNWLRDPCWDIETTEGFDEHVDELTKFHEEQKVIWDRAALDRQIARQARVKAWTGIDDIDMAQCLSTFDEIENQISHQDHYLTSEYLDHNEIITGELAQAQARATLLLAAQVKRVADLLENMDGRDGLAESARIWGSGS